MMYREKGEFDSVRGGFWWVSGLVENGTERWWVSAARVDDRELCGVSDVYGSRESLQARLGDAIDRAFQRPRDY